MYPEIDVNAMFRDWVKRGTPVKNMAINAKCHTCGGYIRTVTGGFTKCSETGEFHSDKDDQRKAI